MEFQTYHHKPTKAIQSALKLASQLFSHPPCNLHYQQPCNIHPSPNTLLPQFIITNHQITPPHPPTQNIPPIEDRPPNPPANIWTQLKNTPIHSIIKHKQCATRDKLTITKQYHSYLCTWMHTSGTTYAKWIPQSSLYRHQQHNHTLLQQYYQTRQTKHFTKFINK
jgi:hypothetical protein